MLKTLVSLDQVTRNCVRVCVRINVRRLKIVHGVLIERRQICMLFVLLLLRGAFNLRSESLLTLTQLLQAAVEILFQDVKLLAHLISSGRPVATQIFDSSFGKSVQHCVKTYVNQINNKF